jgi:hypothetical protein
MSITLDLPEEITEDIVRRAQRAGQTPDAFVTEALKRQLAVERFREAHESLTGCGERASLQTDEDVFNASAGAGQWPPDYFARTAGALAGERFERPAQGDTPLRETW